LQAGLDEAWRLWARVMKISFRVATAFDDLVKAFAVRAMVFCEGQSIAYSIEHDEHEASSVQILGEVQGEPVAAGRIRFLDGMAKLERIAVRARYRGNGFGHQLTDFMVAVAVERGFDTCKVHAQSYLQEFYSQHGFRAQGQPFDEAGIEHIAMVRQASPHDAEA
jgi:predicted GNAT family N-acyltransferase